MERKQHSYRLGIFLYYPGSNIGRRFATHLNGHVPMPYWGKIRCKAVDFLTVAQLIPGALSEGYESWLLLYDTRGPKQFLAFPFPVDGEQERFADEKSIRGYTSSLLEVISRQRWFPTTGYSNLVQNLEREFQQIFRRPYPELFQVIHLDRAFEDVLGSLREEPTNLEYTEIPKLYRNVSQNIKQYRNETLEDLLNGKITQSEAIETFDVKVWDETQSLYNYIRSAYNAKRIVPPIIDRYFTVIDDVTREFLITSETVAYFARQHNVKDFDFTAAGCGLWKAVERELNLSFIWHLRRRRGIAGADPLKVIDDDDDTSVEFSGVKLDKPDRNIPTEYKGVMLGQITNMMNGYRKNGLVSEIRHILDDRWADRILNKEDQGLAHLISEMGKLRNRYAHIAAMSEEKYIELRNMVLEYHVSTSPLDVGLPLLEEILMLKKAIIKYWAQFESEIE